MPPLLILIATSMQRSAWLAGRCLPSVYGQTGVDGRKVQVWIVDDNEDEGEYERIGRAVSALRQSIGMREDAFLTRIMRNRRTRFMSGTGAWNTGIEEAFRAYPHGWLSILDDDDAYLPHHLSDCMQAIDDSTVAVFQRLEWLNEDGSRIPFPLREDLIVPQQFFQGNPGVQGSNMFFKTSVLNAIGGFDEQLPNTTDRDLMIRFLWHVQELNARGCVPAAKIKVLDKLGVWHYNHTRKKVNNQLELKQAGLDMFYRKYRPYFSEEAYHRSLVRAEAFFQYRPMEEGVWGNSVPPATK